MGKQAPTAVALNPTDDEYRFLLARGRWTETVSLALDMIGEVGNGRIPNGFFGDTTTIVDWLSSQPGLSTAPVRKVYRGIAKSAATGKVGPELRALADEAVMVLLTAERRIDDAMRQRAETPSAATTQQKAANVGRTADTKTDTPKTFCVPESPDIQRLAKALSRRPKGESMRAAALEYTGGDNKRAGSLLRQLRRYPQYQSLAKLGGK